MGRLRDETLQGAKWQLLQKATLDPLMMLFSMVLARFISPTEMGTLGLTAVFFAVAAQLASAGFGSALIRKTDRTEADINTMFWFNAAMSLLMAVILFFAAPWFADFYGIPDLILLTRISAVMMFLNSCGSVHWTLYTCRRDFKTPAIVQVCVAILSMPLCLTLAYCGWSFWSVTAQGVFSGLVSLVVVWYISPWKPRFMFSTASFRELFGFGSKLALSGLLYVLYTNLRTFIIGKFYTPADLGLYTRGGHIAGMIPNSVSNMLDSVSYPILSTVQNDDARLLSAYRKYICVSTLVLTWVALISCALAKPLVAFLYGEKWLECVPYLQGFALSVSLNHVGVINLNLLKVKGRSDLFLRLEIIKRAISVLLTFITASISVMAMCWSVFIYCQLAIFVNSYYTGKLIKLTWWQQQKDYLPYVLTAAISTLPAWGVSLLPIQDLITAPNNEAVALTLHYALLLAQLAVGGLSSLFLYLTYLSIRHDAALYELLVCICEHPKFGRFSFLQTWREYIKKKATVTL